MKLSRNDDEVYGYDIDLGIIPKVSWRNWGKSHETAAS
jgi:hypothetical protein